MTNKEKYAKELLDILCETGETPAMVKGKLVACDHTTCDECKFGKHTMFCSEKFTNWAKEEYKKPEVDWAKVPIDTKVLVKDHEDATFLNAHFAYCKDGKPFVFPHGRSSWTVTSDMTICQWRYTEIADQEEWKKYLKYE